MLRSPATKIELDASDLVWHASRFEKRRTEKARPKLSDLPFHFPLPPRGIKKNIDNQIISSETIPPKSDKSRNDTISDAKSLLKRIGPGPSRQQSSVSSYSHGPESTFREASTPAISHIGARDVLGKGRAKVPVDDLGIGRRAHRLVSDEHWSMESNRSSEDEDRSTVSGSVQNFPDNAHGLTFRRRPKKLHDRSLAQGEHEFITEIEDSQLDFDGSNDHVEVIQINPRKTPPLGRSASPDLPPHSSLFSLASRHISSNDTVPHSPSAIGLNSTFTAPNSSPPRLLYSADNPFGRMTVDRPSPTYEQRSSTPPSMPSPPPRTPRRSIPIYNDSLPASSQPQTPAGLPRNGIPSMTMVGAYTAPPAPNPSRRRITPSSVLQSPTRASSTFSRERSTGATGVHRTSDQENGGIENEMHRMRLQQSLERRAEGNGTVDLDTTPPRVGRRNLA